MKSKLIVLLFMLYAQAVLAQSASINLTLVNDINPDGRTWTHIGSAQPISIVNHTAKLKFNMQQPQFVTLKLDADTGDSKSLVFTFFLTAGDQLNVKADFNKKADEIIVNGKGSNNNQPLLGANENPSVRQFYGDTLPGRVIAVINREYLAEKEKLDRYVVKFKPTADFVKQWELNIAYYGPATFFHFKENNKFGVRAAYTRNLTAWNRAQDSLFAAIKLNNDKAIAAFNYKDLIAEYMRREKERLWEEAYIHPEKFFKEWYNADTAAGKKLLRDDPQNLLTEKIINKYFSGKSAEFLYAMLLQDAGDQHDPQNIVEIYDRFKLRYPAGKYTALYSRWIADIKIHENQKLNEHMIFAANNGADLNSFDEVLALARGKTMLVDMWGTWCAPCRNEIAKNSAAIKAYFKNKGLDYLYIANNDKGRETSWKKLIGYFNLEGTHILAGKKLTDDIMKRVEGDGYPTYFIIKKDGSFEKSKAGYPMDQQLLIKQLEAAL